MLIKNLSVSGLLFFGPEGIDLPMRDLNVLIGPNGSGKSNLIEVLALLQASPSSLLARVKDGGGVRDWFWKGSMGGRSARVEAVVVSPRSTGSLLHHLSFGLGSDGHHITRELVRHADDALHDGGAKTTYNYNGMSAQLQDGSGDPVPVPLENLDFGESILSQVRDPQGRYPDLRGLQLAYEAMRFYRNWHFGPAAPLRRSQPTDLRADYLQDDGENIALIVSKMTGGVKRDLVKNLRELIADVEGIDTPVDNGSITVFLDEGGKSIPSLRLSDGTLRYLCLLCILLQPDPPALIAIEEPELGLHPDVLPTLGRLIKEASARTQIVMTTHSQILLDCFSKSAEDVIVCSRGDRGSVFERLDEAKLAEWLKDHTLGELWNMGQIGGTRW